LEKCWPSISSIEVFFLLNRPIRVKRGALFTLDDAKQRSDLRGVSV
jgi:hypothetical protein